jgi:phosphate transport system permease protein
LEKKLITKGIIYLKNCKKRSLLAGCLAAFAGLSVALIGITRLYDSIEMWALTQFQSGPSFDTMISGITAGSLLMLPSIIFFIAGFLIIESHSLGTKLALLLSLLTIIFGISGTSKEFAIAGVLCFLAAEIEFLFRNSTEKNSPITTEKVAKVGLFVAALIGVVMLFAVIAYITIRGIKYVNLDFITGGNWEFPQLKSYISGEFQMGIWDFTIGSFLVVGLGELIAVPLGLGAAIYMSEYGAENRVTSTIRFFVETLAGAPSIILALFGYNLLVWGLKWYTSWLPAAICIMFMILPWNIRIAEESMKAVPYSYREGAYALGATTWQTVRRLVVYAALPGIITGLLLGLGAALGETTILLLTADSGNTALPNGLPLTGPGNGMPTLPIMIYRTFFFDIGEGAMNFGWEKVNVAFAAALVLLVIFLIISAVALLARNYFTKKIKGS